MKYTEALEKALQGRWIRHEDFHDGQYMPLTALGFFKTQEGCHVVPPEKLMKSDKWEVEPAKPKPIVVYGVCEPDGNSGLFSEAPSKITEDGHYQWDGGTHCLEFAEKNLFPKDHCIEYVLVEKEKYERDLEGKQ